MNYKIEQEQNFTLTGFVETNITFANTKNVIPTLWQKPEIWEKFASNSGDLGVLGVCYNCSETGFDYMVGIRSEENINLPQVQVPAMTWIKFLGNGEMPTAIQQMWDDVSEWFKESEYIRSGLPELEIYKPTDNNSKTMDFEIWIPVNHKH